MRVFLLLIAALSVLLGSAFAPVRAAEDFLPPEQAFVFSVRALDTRNVEIVFTVAEGYYMYREAFAAAADGEGVKLGALQVPPGKIKFDENFKKEVETYRGRVAIKLAVDKAPADFTMRVTSQGCADKG